MPRISSVERWCTVCEKRVHELSAMRESEARALLRASAEKRICIDYQFDDAGRVLFRDRRPSALGPTTLALAGLALAITLAASGCSPIESESVGPQPDELACESRLRSPFVPFAPPEPSAPVKTSARLLVVVVDSSDTDGRGIADAAIEVSSETGEHIGWTNSEGTRQFHDLEPGTWPVEVVAGLAEVERSIHVRAGRHSTVTFRIDPTRTHQPERRIHHLRGDVIRLDGSEDPPLGDL